MLGLGSIGQTSENLIRTPQCVINLPSQHEVGRVDRVALTTGGPRFQRLFGTDPTLSLSL